MRKRIHFWVLLTIQVMPLLISGMFMTYLSDALQQNGFFGDIKRTVPAKDEPFDVWYNWGDRHYWYVGITTVLFILICVRIIMWADWYWSDKNEAE